MGIPAPEQATLWTRAAAAREATVRARLKVEQAEAKARAAVEADEAATANRELPAEPVPLEIELPAPATSSGPSTRRKLSMGAVQVGPSVLKVELEVVWTVARKITPRKKQLASKIKKTNDN
ncbi:unnamed protein product [Miscanthus lutarioriparius]|uniref:Uncharacterized protein n=1 Tax=Miscanthus lutarioriparius TaxID=422564 RepID=A0A811RJQ8_9POAL|nr:unnamed protein product [Miscanthus lutarioriparius]